ncbi:MAG: TetR/AcrR family transcriptional regulator [Desulfatibacillaceae bacterium]|nr:TetR/AcrR family transcriptional regulator [Desulfatibacillaceae bacterium]
MEASKETSKRVKATVNGADPKKSELAREKILQAAKEVFSRQPYHAASLRAIAKQGGFDHPLIRYYFPTKAALFTAVVERIVLEFGDAHLIWLQDLDTLSPSQGLGLLVDRVLAYDRQYPHGTCIIMQNIAQVDRLDALPGYRLVPELFARIGSSFRKKVPLSAPEDEIDMFFSCLIAAFVNFLGAPAAHARRMGMDPASTEYAQWVRKAIMAQFVPWLGKLALPFSTY